MASKKQNGTAKPKVRKAKPVQPDTAKPAAVPDLRETILSRLAAGETLRAICRTEGYPAHSTVLLWVSQDTEFADRYARARGSGLEVLADELVEIADDSSQDQLITESGVIQNSEYIARSRLRVDTRKWLLSKLRPDKYGDKTSMELTGKDGGAIELSVAETLRQKRAERLRAVSE